MAVIWQPKLNSEAETWQTVASELTASIRAASSRDSTRTSPCHGKTSR